MTHVIPPPSSSASRMIGGKAGETSERQQGCSNVDLAEAVVLVYHGKRFLVPSIVRITRVGDKTSIFARTCCTRGVCVGTLLLLLFPGRGNGPACAHATIDVLLFLLCRLQDL